jgi:hypothetical protein
LTGDPAGLLQRITELVPLCDDPRIQRAVESGDAFRVYRALVWARLLNRLPAHREVLDHLVKHRRLFARPVKTSPWLGTVNGFGVSFLGSAEAEPDGTRIATHYVVAFFRVPLFPLGAYLVQFAGGGPLRASWRIFARVPMGTINWAWSRVAALSIIGAVLVGGYQAFQASRHHDVVVVNGFNRPLRVKAGSFSLRVPAGAHRTVRLPVGMQTFQAASEDDIEVDALKAEVKSGSRRLVWNIAGAAPVYQEVIFYRSKDSAESKAKPSSPSVYCGQRWIDVPHVDFMFVDPDKQVSGSTAEGSISRVLLTIAPIPHDERAAFCISFLGSEHRLLDAFPILEAEGRLSGWKGDAAQRAIAVATTVNPAKGYQLAKLARDAAPGDVDANREYQTAATSAGHEAEVEAEYRARAAASPDSPAAQYLALRLRHDADAAAATQRLLARFPTDPAVLRLAMSFRLMNSDWAGVLGAWHTLAEHDEAEAWTYISAPVTALVAQGKGADALTLLEKGFESFEGVRFSAAEMYARVSKRIGRGEPDLLVKKLEKGGHLSLLRLRSGLDDGAADASTVTTVLRAAPVDPTKAMSASAELNELDLFNIDASSWGLVYGEAIRTGDAKAAASLARIWNLNGETRDAFDRFVKGEAVPIELYLFSLELRAAARFIRSRNASIEPKEQAQLIAQAKRDDWLSTNVSRAIDGWTPGSAAR